MHDRGDRYGPMEWAQPGAVLGRGAWEHAPNATTGFPNEIVDEYNWIYGIKI